jgi:hypothetical protein
MKHTIYLPDEISESAKEASINLSGLLRTGVKEELKRLKAHQALFDDLQEIEIDLIDEEERPYKGRFMGRQIAEGSDCTVYFSEHDEIGSRILAHNLEKGEIAYLDDASELENWLEQGEYAEAMYALGETPVIDI